MYLKSLKGCRLAIGSYPPFEYDARGGGGKGTLVPAGNDHILYLSFSPDGFSIPPLISQTTKFLSLPLPPGLKIDMSMDKLAGTINQDSGEVLLRFESRFLFTVGSMYKFPHLFVKTLLKTGKVKGHLHEAEGRVRQTDGKTKLVGVSMIPPTGNKLLDSFLCLPNEALAVLQCKIK